MLPNEKQSPKHTALDSNVTATPDGAAAPVTKNTPDTTPAVSEVHASPSTGMPSTLPEPPETAMHVSSVDQEPTTVPGGQVAAAPVADAQSNTPPAATATPSDADDYQPVTVMSTATLPSGSAKRSYKKPILLILAAAMVVLLGSTAAVYALWYNTPDKVMADAIQSAATAQTAITSGSISYTAEDGTDDIKADITFTSSVHNVNSHGQLAANLKITANGKTTQFTGAGMLAESGAAFVKFQDVEKLYSEFIQKQEAAQDVVNDPELDKDIKAFIKKIDGAWIKISQDDIKQLSPSYDYAKLKTCVQSTQNTFKQSKEQQKELRDIYTQNEFIALSPQGSQTIDGSLVNKYAVALDVSKAYDAYKAYQNSTYAKASLACGQYVGGVVSESSEVKKPSDDQVREQQQQIDKVKTEVYITQFGHEMKRLTLAYADNEAKTAFTATFNFGFNQPVASFEPSKSISIKELQSDIDTLQEQLLESDQSSQSAQ